MASINKIQKRRIARLWRVPLVRGVLVAIIFALIAAMGCALFIVKPINKSEEIVTNKLAIMKSVYEPENASWGEVINMISEGQEIEKRADDIKREKGYILTFVSIVMAIVAAIVSAITFNKSNFIFCLLSITLPVIITTAVIAGTTYFSASSTFSQINEIYYESSHLLVKFEERKAVLEKEIASPSPSEPIIPEQEIFEPKVPEPIPLNLNNPYLPDFFDIFQDNPYLMAKCLELSYIPYVNPKREYPKKYVGIKSDALDHEGTYEYFSLNKKYVRSEQRDRFNYLEKAVDSRTQADNQYASQDDDPYEWYAPSDNRQMISVNCIALGLEHHRVEEWADAQQQWDEAICWQARSMRSLLTELGTATDELKNACNTMISIYRDHLGNLKNKPGVDNEKLTQIKTIIKAYEIFRDSL